MVDTNELLQKQEVEIKKKSEQSQLLIAEQEELERQLQYLNDLIASQDAYLQNLSVMESTIEKNIKNIEDATDVEIDVTVPEGLIGKIAEKNKDAMDKSPAYEAIDDEETPLEEGDVDDFFEPEEKTEDAEDSEGEMTPVSGSEEEEEEPRQRSASKITSAVCLDCQVTHS